MNGEDHAGPKCKMTAGHVGSRPEPGDSREKIKGNDWHVKSINNNRKDD